MADVPDGGSQRWLNGTVWGMALTSFFSDLGHEAQSTLLPSFLAALGCPPLALGAIEGITDAASSFMKLGAGWISDRLPRRKPVVVAGYAATGLASGIIALAQGWPLVLGGKLFGWLGRGIRGPLRNAILTDAIPPEARGRAFGFHRTGDTLGAILGPLGVVLLLGWAASHGGAGLPFLRTMMAWTMIPGLIAAGIMAWIIREKHRTKLRKVSLRHALSQMPGTFRRYLFGVGLFGAGDYAHTLLILAASQLLAQAFRSSLDMPLSFSTSSMDMPVCSCMDLAAMARFSSRLILPLGAEDMPEASRAWAFIEPSMALPAAFSSFRHLAISSSTERRTRFTFSRKPFSSSGMALQGFPGGEGSWESRASGLASARTGMATASARIGNRDRMVDLQK